MAAIANADIQYRYDGAGRLIEVVDGAGDSASYTYDAAGNITSIARASASAASVAGFSPSQGQVGDAVTIYGTGFSTTAMANVVRFNDVQATVLTASSNQLSVTVPVGATTGSISVTVGTTTVTSASVFTVTQAHGAPSISSFTPSVGAAGTAIAILGSNFDPIASRNVVSLNGTQVPVTSATATSLTVTVPANGTSGPIEVQTPDGIAQSISDFTVLSAGITAAQLGPVVRTTVDSAPFALAIPANKQALVLFNGIQGRGFGLGVEVAIGAVGTFYGIAPDGSAIRVVCDQASVKYVCRIPVLPSTGTYTLRVTLSGTTAANLTLTLSSDVIGTLVANAAATTFSTARLGQHARYTFNATAGQNVSLTWNGATFAGYWSFFNIYQPDGTQLAAPLFGLQSPSGSLALTNLPATGVYSVLVKPYVGSSGQVNLQLQNDAKASVEIDGASYNAVLAAGQVGDYSFSGTVGQRLGLGISGVTLTPSSSSVDVYLIAPDNVTRVISCGTYYSAGGRCVLPPLPSTGTFTVRVMPSGATAAKLTLSLSSEVTGTLEANAAATTFNTARVGQNARYTFYATAGQNASLTWSGATFAGTWSYFNIYKPDGTLLAAPYFGSASPSGVTALTNLPATGVYTVLVQPYGAGTGQVNLQLAMNAADSLAVDGASYNAVLAAGQTGDYTFSGTVGQRLGLGISGVTLTPSSSSVDVYLIAPDNVTTVMKCGTYYSAGGRCVLPPLPSTGTFTVRVVPSGTTAAKLTLTLSSEVTGTLEANAAATTFSTARVGQNARYTFNATAGQNASLIWSGATFAGTWSYWSYFYIYKPDGTLLAAPTFNSSSPSGSKVLANLPATGVYTVLVQPYGTTTGQVNVELEVNAADSLAVDGASYNAVLEAGQTGDYTFSGAVGQRLGLGISDVTLTPSSSSVDVYLIGPDNVTSVMSCGTYNSSGGRCVLPPLPSTGTFTVRVTPSGTTAANLTLTLSSEVTGTLVANAAATTFSTARVGQNARYTFNATAGQNASLTWSGATFAGTWSYFYIYKPDGTQLAAPSFGATYPSGATVLTNLPATGVYTVFVHPYGTSTGQVSLQLLETGSSTPGTETVDGTLTVDGADTTVSFSGGSTVNYTFAGTVGQRLGLGISGVTLTPGGSSVGVYLIAPDNVTRVVSCGTYSSSGGRCVLPPLPSTGTFTVRVTPSGATAANLTLTLSSEVTGTLDANAAVTTFSTARVGQNARYTFNATAGQNASLTWSGATFASYWSSFNVYKPDGAQLATQNFGTISTSGSLVLPNLPATGAYTVLVQPYGTTTGQVNVELEVNAADSLAVDGASYNAVLAPGQTGDYTFSGTVGQRLGLGISGVTLTPSSSSVDVYLIAPDNVTRVLWCGTYYSSGGRCVLPPLPSTGTFTVRVVPSGATAAKLTLTLSSEVTGTLEASAAVTTFSTARVGQNARYTFNATAGQNASLTWSGATFPSTWSYFYIYKPDGAQLAAPYFGSLSPSGATALTNLPATGVYTVLVQPYGAGTGQVNVQLALNAADSLAVDGASYNAVLAPGQTGDYTFSGTVGQRLGLGISGVTLTPSNSPVDVYLIAPDNVTRVIWCGTYYSDGGRCVLPPLPSTGKFTVRVMPSGATAAKLTLTLSSEVAGTLEANAAVTTFSTARVGQNARYTFNATAGQNASLTWRGASFPGTWSYFHIYKPDGTKLADQLFGFQIPGGSLALTNLPATGSYTVLVQPYGASTGQVSVGLLSNSVFPLPTDGSWAGISLQPWQAIDYSFVGSVGQRLNLFFDQVAVSQASKSVTVEVLDSGNHKVATCTVHDPVCEIPTVDVAGNYTIRLSVSGDYSASFRMSTGVSIAQ